MNIHDKATTSMHTIHAVLTILARLGVLLLFSLAVIGCGPGGILETSPTETSPTMEITPPGQTQGTDLILQSISVSNSTLTTNEPFTLTVTVHNQGNRRSQSTTLRSYRRPNSGSLLYDSDNEIVSQVVGIISPSRSITRSFNLTAPPDNGIYYYGVCVGAVSGESNTGNNCSGLEAIRVTVELPTPLPSPEGEPDLVSTSIWVRDNDRNTLTTLTPGQPFILVIWVFNHGDTPAPATTLRYKRHTSLPIQTSALTVATTSISSLEPDTEGQWEINLTAPSTSGTYYYGACVDAVSGESNTGNNCSGHNSDGRVMVQ